MASSLDDLLDGSAPPATPRTAELERELAALISEAESGALRRSRSRKRILIAGLATIGVVGAGATASATGLLPQPWFDTPSARTTQPTSNGTSCDLAFRAKGHDDPAHPVDAATRDEAVRTADTFLKGFDFSTIDIDEAMKRLPPRATADTERGPAETVEQYETYAVQTELDRLVGAHLSAHGLPATAVSVSAMTSCEGARQ